MDDSFSFRAFPLGRSANRVAFGGVVLNTCRRRIIKEIRKKPSVAAILPASLVTSFARRSS